MSQLPPSLDEMQMQQQQQAAMEERRQGILEQILEPEARERLSRLRLVRADKARMVEDALITGATNGRIKSKLTEEQLIQMLEQLGGEGGDAAGVVGGKKSKVVVQRRKYGIEEDDDDDDADLM